MRTIKNRNTNGRPTKPPSVKKSYKITIKMDTEEYYSLRGNAGVAGMNRSEFIRRCIRSSEIKQRLSPELMGHIRQLCGMANNINQIARTANAAGYYEVHMRCLAINQRLDGVIKKIEDDC